MKTKRTKIFEMDDCKKLIIGKLSRIVGQLEGVKRMIEDGKDVEDVIIQLAAANMAAKSVGNNIIELHVQNCLLPELKDGNKDAVKEISTLYKRFE